jgi:osmotically-inducible protein OsmY
MLGNMQLQQRVLEALDWEPGLEAKQIGVAANGGVVTLTGIVRSYADRYTAERVIKRLSGVKAIANDLEVRLPGDFRRSDGDLAAAAVRALEWDVNVPNDRIKIRVTDGMLTLEGQVEWQYQRQAAEQALKNLMGVRGVNNQLTLTPRLTPSDLKNRIEAAFKRTAELDARGIKVETTGGKVTLTGSVHTWAEREEAEDAVWAAPGVNLVEDRLAVVV